MPIRNKLSYGLLLAALPGCFISPATYTEEQCLNVDASQKQCRNADDVWSEFAGHPYDDEVLEVSYPKHMVLHIYSCTYAVSIRGINGVARMPSCSSDGMCTVSGSSGLPGTMLPIEHTTITMFVTSDSCPARDVAAPSLQALRNDITLVSVDAPGTLETTTDAKCCYQVTYRESALGD